MDQMLEAWVVESLCGACYSGAGLPSCWCARYAESAGALTCFGACAGRMISAQGT